MDIYEFICDVLARMAVFGVLYGGILSIRCLRDARSPGLPGVASCSSPRRAARTRPFPVLHRAIDLIIMDDSERRSPVLVNPGLAPRHGQHDVHGVSAQRCR